MIPANTYDGQAEAVPTVAITNILVTRADLPDDVVYDMTRLLFDNWGAWVTPIRRPRTSSWKRLRKTCRSRCTPGPSATTRKKALYKRLCAVA